MDLIGSAIVMMGAALPLIVPAMSLMDVAWMFVTCDSMDLFCSDYDGCDSELSNAAKTLMGLVST